jgi:hypothetical protein
MEAILELFHRCFYVKMNVSMKSLFLLVLGSLMSTIASAQNEGVETNSTKALPLIAEAAANAINIQVEPAFDDSLGLFSAISDSSYCEIVNGWVNPNHSRFFLGALNFMNKNVEIKHWNLKDLRFSATYRDGELIHITSGCYLPIGHQECSSLNYIFYGNELIHTYSSCISYIGAMCSAEYSSNFYTWRNNEIICSGGNGRVKGESLDFYLHRCHCAADLNRDQWLDALTEILFYMHHVKTEKE